MDISLQRALISSFNSLCRSFIWCSPPVDGCSGSRAPHLAGRRRAALQTQYLTSHMALSRSADAPLVVRARCPRVVGFWCAPDEPCDRADSEMGEERTHDRIYIKRKGRGSEKKWPTREDVLDSGRSLFLCDNFSFRAALCTAAGKSCCSSCSSISGFFALNFHYSIRIPLCIKYITDHVKWLKLKSYSHC